MSGLLSSLRIGAAALQAQQTALQVTSNNIANVNTPGYHRQQAALETTPPEQTANGQLGTGVKVASITSVRDQFLELRISQATQNAGRQETISGYLSQVESVFNTGAGGIQAEITGFFNSFSALSADVSSSPLRYGVISAGTSLAATFRGAAQKLIDVRNNSNSAVADGIGEVNDLTTAIAKLNEQIAVAESDGSEATALRDQRSTAVNQLSGLMDIHYYESDDGTLTISTAGGNPLVTAGFAQTLKTTSTGPDGILTISAGPYVITDAIKGGKVGGLLEFRDRLVPTYQQQLDTLAQSIISQVNAAHSAGTDLQSPPSSPSANLFNPVAAVAGAAAAFSVNPVLAADPRYIAAGQGGSPGNNANALAIGALAFQKVLTGGTETFAEAFGTFQFKIGTDKRSAATQLESENAQLVQLSNSRDAVSGVSLDEEAVDLIRFQRAYQAAARFINVIDQLTGDLIENLGR